MPSHRDVRDPIHGFIRIEGREGAIVDAPVFQRLRQVRQLAMAYLTYPSATHSRFEHTLGVLHVAGRMCARLGVDAPHSQTIRFAALLHDIGHGPFSHPSEEVLAAVASDDVKKKAGGLDKIHELITRQIIRTDPDLHRLIPSTGPRPLPRVSAVERRATHVCAACRRPREHVRRTDGPAAERSTPV